MAAKSKVTLDANDEIVVIDEEQPHNWQTDFKLKTALLQRDVYAFETELRILEKSAPGVDTVLERVFQVLRTLGMTVDSNIETEHNLKAAIRAGWILAPLCEVAEISPNGRLTARKQTRYLFDDQNVDEMHPGKVRWYGREIIAAYNKAVEIPDPN